MRFVLAALSCAAVLTVRWGVRRHLTDNEDLFALGLALVAPLAVVLGMKR